VESQEQAPATPHDLTNTPSRRTTAVPEKLSIPGSEKEVWYGDFPESYYEIGESEFESLVAFFLQHAS
jgi:hypothetical protein